MGSFHSSGRGTPDKQITKLGSPSASLPTPLVDVVPSPDKGVARFVGASEDGFQLMSPFAGVFTLISSSGSVTVDFHYDGPEGTFKIGSSTFDASGTGEFLDDVQFPIGEGESIKANIPDSSTESEATVIARFMDYRMGDVLKLGRTLVASGAGWQDVLPSPPENGTRHVALGVGEELTASVLVNTGSVEASLGLRFNEDGNLLALGSGFTVPAGEYQLFEGIPGTTTDPDEALQAESTTGDVLALMTYLRVPNAPA
jgi:hypothetical protein